MPKAACGLYVSDGHFSCQLCGRPTWEHPRTAQRDRRKSVKAREDAIARVDSHAADEWKDRAYLALYQLALTNQTFTTDLLWDLVESPPEPRALGPVVRRCSRDQLFESTDEFVSSDRPANNRRPVRVWRSLVYQSSQRELF